MKLPTLPDSISRELRDYQKQPAAQILRALQNGATEWGYAGAVDLSAVGIGKSYIDLAAALATGKTPVILCPVVGVQGWRSVLDRFGASARYVGSYEAIRGGYRREIGEFSGGRFHWKTPQDIILILDEAQYVKGQDSLTTHTIGGAIWDRIPIIAASATMAHNPLDLRIAGRITGLHTGGKNWLEFIRARGCYEDINEPGRWIWGRQGVNREQIMDDIHRILIPARGCRVRKSDMGAQPGTTIQLLPLANVPEAAAIEQEWTDLDAKIKHMERAGTYPRDVITNTRRAGRMKIWKKTELALVPIVAERVKACLAQGKSVVVFFSFTQSREAMGRILKTRAGFYGGQTPKQRAQWQAEFQANREHVLLCNIGSGGASVSLQDLTGERPRETFIFPTDNPVKMGQAPGRVDRNGGQTHSLQWIPCIAGGFSQRMVESTARKLADGAIFNDGAQQKAFDNAA